MRIEIDQIRGVWRRNGSDFVPQIWLGDDSDRPKLCNCQIVALDCEPRSFLRWNQEREQAAQLVAQDCLLAWRLDSGLVNLSTDLLDESHMEMVLRAFDHFNCEIWPQFGDHSVCAILDVGQISQNTSIDQIKALSTIVRTLTAALPLECLTGLLIDASGLSSGEQIQKLNKELFPHLCLFLKTHLAQLASLTWNSFSRSGSVWSIPPIGEYARCPTPPIGIALLQIKDLSDPDSWHLLGKLAEELEQHKIPYRVIPMSSLHEQWHQLDEIVIAARTVTLREIRQLQGFCAAGGTVVRAGNPLVLAQEIEFSKWKQKKLFHIEK